MKKLKIALKAKQAYSWLLLLFPALLILLLFLSKDKLNDYAAKAIRAEAGSQFIRSESAVVDSTYNYIKNGQNFQFTFLEFGAKGCSACNRMEVVMNEMREKYPGKVNVFFVNILIPKNQGLMKYYSIVSIPTQVLLNTDGIEYFRHIGYCSTTELVKEFAPMKNKY